MLLPIRAGKGGMASASGTRPRPRAAPGWAAERFRIRAAPPGPVAEGLGQVPFQGRRDFGDGDPAPGFGRQRGHPGVGNAARDDAVIPGQVAVAVQRQPMHGDAAGDPCADRPDLAVGRARDPGPAAARHPDRGHPEIGAGPDHGLFQRPYVGDHVDGLAELHDRVADQLAGPVPGDLAAAVHVDDRCTGIPGRPVRGGRPLARRVHRLVLEQQAAVRNLVGHPPRMDAPLPIPALQVVHRGRTEGQVNKLAHFSQLTRGRIRESQAGRPRKTAGRGPPYDHTQAGSTMRM